MCEQINSRLVSISSENEMKFVMSILISEITKSGTFSANNKAHIGNNDLIISRFDSFCLASNMFSKEILQCYIIALSCFHVIPQTEMRKKTTKRKKRKK